MIILYNLDDFVHIIRDGNRKQRVRKYLNIRSAGGVVLGKLIILAAYNMYCMHAVQQIFLNLDLCLCYYIISRFI